MAPAGGGGGGSPNTGAAGAGGGGAPAAATFTDPLLFNVSIFPLSSSTSVAVLFKLPSFSSIVLLSVPIVSSLVFTEAWEQIFILYQ